MAELRFDILGKEGEVSAATFKESIQYAVSLLREFDSAISGMRSGVLNWYIQNLHSNGMLSVLFISHSKRSRTAQNYPQNVDRAVTSNMVSGFEDIELKCATPPYLSEFGLQKVEKLADLIGKNGTRGFHFESQSRGVDVTKQTRENISKLLPIRRTSIGSVEGTLEGINIHGKRPRFIVYHAITKKAVTCILDDREKLLHVAPQLLGKEVAVFGTLHKNINGDTLRISVESIKELTKGTVRSSEQFQDPEFSKAKTTAEYLRIIRGR